MVHREGKKKLTTPEGESQLINVLRELRSKTEEDITKMKVRGRAVA